MFSVALLLLLAAGSCVKCEQLTQPASVTVQPGQRLTITCQVSYSLSSYFTAWIRQPAGKGLEWIGMAAGSTTHYKDSLKNKFSIDSDSSSKTVTLNGQNVQPEDTAVYYCARRELHYAFDYWGKGTMVTVTSATSTGPTVWPLTECDSAVGQTVSLGCLATAFTPSSVTYSWTKDGVALTDFIQYPPVQKDSAYTGISQIRVTRQDWDNRAVFKCLVTHAAGNAQCTFTSPPLPPCVPPTLKVSASPDEGNEASFTCFAKDFSPNKYQIKWLKNDADIANKIEELTTDSKDRVDNGTKVYSTAGFLMLPAREWSHGDKITCQFKGCHGLMNSSVVHNSHPPCPTCPDADATITIIDPTLENIFLNKKGTVVCKVHVNKPSVTKISWEDEQGNEMVSSTVTPVKDTKKTLSLSLDITYDEWSQGIRRYCSVEHTEWLEPHKALYERSIGGQLQRPSVFMLPPVEHTRKEMVTLTCYVRDFFPQEVYVSWLVDDMEADSTEYEFHTTDPVDNHGTYSAYSQLLLRLDQWQRKDVVYSCAVHHESVANTTKAIVRSIGYTTFDKTNLVNLNLNIPETCKAQ